MLIITVHAITEEMHDIAKQASILAAGLQNAAPPGTSLQSVQYLLETAAQLEKTCDEINKVVNNSNV